MKLTESVSPAAHKFSLPGSERCRTNNGITDDRRMAEDCSWRKMDGEDNDGDGDDDHDDDNDDDDIDNNIDNNE